MHAGSRGGGDGEMAAAGGRTSELNISLTALIQDLRLISSEPHGDGEHFLSQICGLNRSFSPPLPLFSFPPSFFLSFFLPFLLLPPFFLFFFLLLFFFPLSLLLSLLSAARARRIFAHSRKSSVSPYRIKICRRSLGSTAKSILPQKQHNNRALRSAQAPREAQHT